LIILACLMPGLAWAQSVRVDKDQLIITPATGEPTTLALGCTALGHVVHDKRVLVACDPRGVVVVDISGAAPKVLLRAAISVPTPATPPAPDPPDEPAEPERPQPPPLLEIVERSTGKVVVDAGAEDGIEEGRHMAIVVAESENLGGGQKATRWRVVAVGKVTAVGDSRSQVTLGLNERVPPKAKARLTDAKLTASRVRPPRLGRIWDVKFNVRPFLALGTLGVGTINDLTIAYRMDAPVSIQALFEPAGFGFSDAGNVIAMAGNIVGAYDSRYFEIGLGLGWSAVNSDIESQFGARAQSDGGIEPKFDKVRSGLSLAQVARLGALDGLHLSLHNSFLLFDDQFNYGGTHVSFQIPLSTRLWMLVRGGGGRSGSAYGELGLRVLLTGNGDKGSIFLTPGVGGGYLFGQKEEDCEVFDSSTGGMVPGKCTEDIDYAGPMVGIGVEWRL